MIWEAVGAAGCGAGVMGAATALGGCVADAGRVDGETALAATEAALAAGADDVTGRIFTAGLVEGFAAAE